jgi:cytochrome c553
VTSFRNCILPSWTFITFALLFSIGAQAESPAMPTVASVCAPCHGLDGVGRDVEVPNIAGQHSIYLREQLLAFKSGRRKHPEMYFVGRHLTDREIDELVVYYSTLPHR